MILDAEILRINYPITGLEIYPNNVWKIVRTQRVKMQSVRKTPKEKIKRMSKKSLINLMAVARSTEVKFSSMLTLTYGKYYPKDGDIVKRDINALMSKWRRDNLGQYLWFLEFQKRGAPHLHVLTEVDCITSKMRADYGIYWTQRQYSQEFFLGQCPVAEQDANILKMLKFNTHPTVWELIRESEGARNYMMKYAAKEKQKTVPDKYKNVGRFWAASDGVRSDPIEVDANESEVRELLRVNGHKFSEQDVLPKTLWF